MGYSIGPKIGIDGEAEFRKQIRDINAAYKALEAETRAVTSAFEANGNEQGKLESQSKQLTKMIDNQKDKLKYLEDAVSKANAKYGEGSVEATRLRGAMYDTQATIAKLESELNTVNSQLANHSDTARDAALESERLKNTEASLNDQLSDVDAEIRAISAETRLLISSYKDTDDQSNKLKATSQQLEKQIDSQKKKIELLKSAVDNASKQYGENSSEANKLRASLYDTQATIAKLESELTDTDQKLDAMAKGLDQVGDEADSAGDKVLDFSDILNANLVSDVATDFLQDAGDAIGDFVKGSLDAASDVNAAGSQFSQTFGELESTAKSTLESISGDTKIAVTRMQGDFTTLYAFTKGVGADSEEALDIAGRAMLAAADNAAYYDKSIEEATEHLQSFLKGNYENDAALGIAATETARNTKANELYAMSFNDLSEAQKVDVLLSMVEAGNQASGALGMAAREAEEWTNVQGELDEALKQMQATLGQPALKLVVPIIQDITAGIYELIEKSDWQKLDGSISDFTDSMEDAEKQFSETSREAETSALMAKKYVQRLEELESAGLDTAEAQREYANIVGQLNELYPELNLQINESTGLVNLSKEAILGEVEAMKEKALYMAMEEQYTAALKAQADATLAIRDAEYARTGIQAQIDVLQKQLTASTGMTIDQLIRLYNSQIAANSAMQASGTSAADAILSFALMGDAIGSLTPAQMEMVSQLIQLQTEKCNLTREISEGADTVSSYDEKLARLEKTLTGVTSETGNTAASQDTVSTKIQEVKQNLADLEVEYENALTAARESIDSQIGLFDELSTESKMTTQEIITNWQNQKAAFENYAANLQKAVDMKLDQALIKQLSDGSNESMLILDQLVNDVEVNIDEINAAFGGLGEAKDTAAEAMESVNTGIREKMDAVVADAVTWGYDIVSGAAKGVRDNSYIFENAMAALGSGGSDKFHAVLDIHSPSRVMEDGGEDTVMGAVLGVEKNIAKFEASMAKLGKAGDSAFLDERLSAADAFPSYMEAYTGGGNTTNNNSVTYSGGFAINIYQQPGESSEDLADRVREVLQNDLMREEASLSAY